MRRSFVVAAMLACAAMAQDVRVVVTSKAGDRLREGAKLHFTRAAKTETATFEVRDDVRHQTMAGFGASFLEAGMICLNSLDERAQEEVLKALFDPKQGAGFSAMKTVIAGTDFMSAGPWYTYDDTPGDVTMEHFSIARDLGPNGLIPYIKRARRYGQFALQAPMDYPPDWMLFDVNSNQDVNPAYFDALALYYLRYLREYERNGVVIDYLSLFNEPGIYTKISFERIHDLIKDHVGPLLEKEKVRTKIQLSEANTRSKAYSGYPVVLDDAAARKYVSVMPYHGYEAKQGDYDKIRELGKRYPDLPLWMTEVCHAYAVGTPRSVALPKLDYEDGDYWGQQIFNDVEAGTSAWIYWNMILDQRGGPWLISPVHGNPDNNGQHSVVMIDTEKKTVTYTGLYYYLTHFSKFVRPGAQRIESSGSLQGVRMLVFRTPDGGHVAELMNSLAAPARVKLRWQERVVSVELPALSMNSLLWQ
jgi:glucosylceramidase